MTKPEAGGVPRAFPGNPPVKPEGKCGYQMQQMIETHLPHLTQAQLAGLVLWVCGAILAGSACQNAVASAPLALGRLEQPAPVSPGVVVRRQRPGPSLQDRTGRESLLRAAAEMGPGLVAFRLAGPRIQYGAGSGGGPHIERGRNHRHRHQRGLPGLRHSRGLAHPPRQPARVLDGPDSGTAAGSGPGGPQGNDRDRAVRPGPGQSQIVEADTRSEPAPGHDRGAGIPT